MFEKNTLNSAVSTLITPPIAATQQWARAYDGSRGPLIDLAQAVPGYPPHPDLLQWLADAAGSIECAGYGDIQGEHTLRQAYAEHDSTFYGAPLAAENVHITAGCNQAFVAAVMAVAGQGDRVLLLDPFYFNHQSTLAMLGIQADRIPCRPENGFVPDPHEIEAALTADVRAVVMITPNNPTGAVYPPDVLATVYRLCVERGIWLLLDETYRDFLADKDTRPHELFSDPAWGNTLIRIYSFSKSFCIPGHRLGAITADPRVVAEIAKIMDNLQICAPRSPQHALAKALPALAAWREDNRLEILARARAFTVTMHEMPTWEVVSLGAYFAYVQHPYADSDSVTIAKMLAETAGIATLPGEFFGNGQEAFLRIAFANADQSSIGWLGERLRSCT